MKQTSQAPTSRFRRWNLCILLLTGFLDHLALTSPVPLFIEMVLDPNNLFLGTESTSHLRGFILGLLTAIPPLTQAIFAPLVGRLSDLKGRRYALLIGVIFLFFGNILGILAIAYKSLVYLFINRICLGICLTNVSVLQASMADISEEHQRTNYFSYLYMSFGVGFTAGPIIGATAMTWFDDKIPSYMLLYIVNLILSVTSLLLVTFLRIPSSQSTKNHQFKGDKLPRIVNVFFIAMFFFTFGWCTWNEFIPVFYKEELGLTSLEIGHFLSYRGFSFALASLFLVPLAIRNIPMQSLLKWSLLLQAVGCFASIYVTQIPPLLIHTLVLLTFNALYMTLTNEFVAEFCHANIQGKAQGSLLAIYAFASSLSSLIFGPFISTYTWFCPILSAVFILMGFIIYTTQVEKRAKAHSFGKNV